MNLKFEARAEHSAGINPNFETNSNAQNSNAPKGTKLLSDFDIWICFGLVRNRRFARYSNFGFFVQEGR
jgi:hypothetical protein